MLARRLPIVLPTIHVALTVLTLLPDKKAASGGNPFVCVDFPFSLPLVARGDTPTVLVVAVLATAWWCFVGQIGWSSRQHKINRALSVLGAVLEFLICAFDFSLMADEFQRIVRDPKFSLWTASSTFSRSAFWPEGLSAVGLRQPQYCAPMTRYSCGIRNWYIEIYIMI